MTEVAASDQRYNYTAKLFRLAWADSAGDATDTAGVTRGILTCPRMSPSDVPPTDLSGCAPSAWGTNRFSTVGWATPRRAWNSPASGASFVSEKSPEHMLIAQEAANLAGFGTTTIMSQVFWVRYPVLDQFVASPVNATQYVVGQTDVPAPFSAAAAHAVRAVYLPELAQLPDASYSVWDWAAGNEICPIEGFDGTDTPGVAKGFSSAGIGRYDVNNCHDFAKLLGPLNPSHFKPDSRAMWAYYHSLAVQRMQGECTTLQSLVTPLDQPVIPGVDEALSFRTEEQECEREAMVYEMFAQHFLQDNWSTGHMWERWGAPDLNDVPTTYHNPLLWSLQYPSENIPARQIIHSQILAAASGVIHGSKAVTDSLLGNVLPFATDDPLCGPLYPNIGQAIFSNGWTVPNAPVQWTASGMVASGAGDYHWSVPPALGTVSISGAAPDTDYTEQRKRLLLCAAKSMYDVYTAGPMQHGVLGATTSVDGATILGLDPTTDYCWGNWATNASMEGAQSPLFIPRNWLGNPGPAIGLATLTPLLNAVTAQSAGSAFVNQSSGYDPA